MKHLLLAGALLALQAGTAHSQTLQNGSFEAVQPGSRQLPADWDIAPAPGYAIALDSGVALGGRRALHLASGAGDPSGFQPFRQSVAVQVTQPTLLHLTARVKTQQAANVALLCQYWDAEKRVGQTNTLMQRAALTGTGEWRTLDLALYVLPTMRRLVVGGFYQGQGETWFDDLQLIGPASNAEPAAAVRRYVNLVADITHAHSLVKDSVDWPATQRTMLALARGLQTPAESYPVVNYLLSVLARYGDHHSMFYTPARMQANRVPASAAGAAVALVPSAHYLGDGLASLALPSFGSNNPERAQAFAEQAQALIRQLDTEHDIAGWVLDLRADNGGNMYPMLAGVGPLLGEGTVGYFVNAGQEQAIGYRAGEAYAGRLGRGWRVAQPYQLRRPGSPVAVLVGPRTASSGEITAMAFIGRPATRLFGQPTGGYTSANRTYKLPDGAGLILAVTTEADRTHQLHLGPLVPDEIVPPTPAGSSADPALQAASAWLRKQAPAGKS